MKSVANISQERLQRLFVGTQDELNPAEKWYEAGHFIQGFELIAKRVTQTDGRLRERSAGLGRRIEGSCVPAQNAISDYRFYEKLFNGTRSVALLVGTDMLWLFRLQSSSGVVLGDNRIEIVTDIGYGETRSLAQTSFSGWVPSLELYRVKSLELNGTSLRFTTLESLSPEGLPALITFGQ
jgi:hypothetical protein